MRLTTAISSAVLVGLVAASPPKLHRRVSGGSSSTTDGQACVEDALHACFASSLSQASAYCTNSVITVAETTNTVTVTPTVTITDAVTETATLTATEVQTATTTVTEIREAVNKRAARRKRGSCNPKPPLACLASLPTAAILPAQFTSACSCIGVTTATVTATVTADAPHTVVETQTATATVTDSVTQTSVVTVTQISTSTKPVPTPSVTPVVVNGDFETGTLDGWSVVSRTGTGDTQELISRGTGYALKISTSYFIRSAPAAVSFGQTLNCVAGTSYNVSFLLYVMSSYTNGNPWSVVLGGVTLVSGPGASIPVTQYTFPFTCGSTDASNSLTFRLQSNSNRAASLIVDNVSATAV